MVGPLNNRLKLVPAHLGKPHLPLPSAVAGFAQQRGRPAARLGLQANDDLVGGFQPANLAQRSPALHRIGPAPDDTGEPRRVVIVKQAV